MSKAISSTEKQLIDARARLEAASAALAPRHKGGEWEEFRAAHDEVLRLERALAKERNEPYAVPCDFPVEWDTGAPCPFLLCNDQHTFLTFYVREPRRDWDGTTVTIVDPASSNNASLCLVTFNYCASAKLGAPNDEVHGGHPLDGRGLKAYTAQIVKNSPWLREVEKTNSVHSRYNPARWQGLSHYVFWFHDSTFECLAESFSIELSCESMPELLARVHARLLA